MNNTSQPAKGNNMAAKVAQSTVKNATIVFGGLVRFDTKVMSAAREEGSGFKMVVKMEDGSIVPASQVYTAGGKFFNYDAVGRALENGDGTFLWIEKEEINSCKAPSNSEIQISKFVPLHTVDPVFFDKGYFLAPDPGKLKKGQVANPNNGNAVSYATLVAVMKAKNLVAQAKIEFKGKEHNVIIRTYNDGMSGDVLMLHTIYTSADVRTVNIMRPTVELNDKLIELCGALVDELTGEFDRNSIVSDSDIKLNQLIETKRAIIAGQATPSFTAATTNAGGEDLMAKLAASLANVKKSKTETPVEEKVAQ